MPKAKPETGWDRRTAQVLAAHEADIDAMRQILNVIIASLSKQHVEAAETSLRELSETTSVLNDAFRDPDFSAHYRTRTIATYMAHLATRKANLENRPGEE